MNGAMGTAVTLRNVGFDRATIYIPTVFACPVSFAPTVSSTIQFIPLVYNRSDIYQKRVHHSTITHVPSDGPSYPTFKFQYFHNSRCCCIILSANSNFIADAHLTCYPRPPLNSCPTLPHTQHINHQYHSSHLPLPSISTIPTNLSSTIISL